MKSSKQIRQEFIDFFKDKGHTFVRSSPVVPLDDPTLLFTNAGMNQFKPIFMGESKADQPRAVNSQKCIRVSGKHNDLEEVGVDHYHHTFFEMLGNWSFGDYYKKEAITWAWELLTEVWGFDERRLWATVYETDDEAAQLWLEQTGIGAERVLRFGAKENFWEMGATGPCGPCSEIHYYIGDDLGNMDASGVNASEEYREIWNLVFIQHNRLADGTLEDLPQKHVDTGAGLERIVGVLQGVSSNYATDLFTPLIEEVVSLTGKPYSEGESGTPHRVIADHVRMIAFSLADGAMPSNEGRGYVVRRILRRAARFGRMLEQHEPFIYRLVDTLVEVMGAAYPELAERKEHVKKVIEAEEAAFSETLDRGLEIFSAMTQAMKPGDTLPGAEVFKLYDTFGFPADLTALMARERDLEVDMAGFDAAMAQQRERARAGGSRTAEQEQVAWTTVHEGIGTEFLGYETTSATAKLRRYRPMGEELYEVILDQTPFYAESGGQVGDTGSLRGDGLVLDVIDTRKAAVEGHEEIVHHCILAEGKLDGGATLDAEVDAARRQAIRLNHTATHLMHKALKVVLGGHVQQAGSLVDAVRLRFDFTHYEKMTPDQKKEIEALVNGIIRDNSAVSATEMPFDEARATGAVAMFGEKYGDRVRVIDVPGFSKELCGGTHVDRTGDIGAFKIVSESALASGVRRIEAVTGAGALAHAQVQAELIAGLSGQLNVSPDQIAERMESQRLQIKELQQKVKAATGVSSADLLKEILGRATDVGGVTLITEKVAAGDMDAFKDLAVALKQRLGSGVVVLGSIIDGKPNLVVAVSDDLKASVPAGEFIKVVAGKLKGGGGGSPILATAGGKDATLMDGALAKVPQLLAAYLAKGGA
ncbi:MAG: alanine--tRNA ligase [Candidatus Marinimicrobia bacterium]|nr:alanine--tRNA ligase [Candidatus Neomarinimicrobiota bacterium]